MHNDFMTFCIFCGLETPTNNSFCQYCHKPVKATKPVAAASSAVSPALREAKKALQQLSGLPLVLKVVLSIILTGLLAIVAAMVVLLMPKKSELPLPGVFSSRDQRAQIVAPVGWQEDLNLYYKAQIQVSDKEGNLHLVVNSISKETRFALPSDLTLEKCSQTPPPFFMSDTCAEMVAPVSLRINNHAALQRELRAIYLGEEVRGLHTLIETPTHFHEITAWASLPLFQKNQTSLSKIVESFDDFDVHKKYSVEYVITIQERDRGILNNIKFVTDKLSLNVTIRETFRDRAYSGGGQVGYSVDVSNLPETVSVNGLKFTFTDKAVRTEDRSWTLQQGKSITIDLDKLMSHYGLNSKSSHQLGETF